MAAAISNAAMCFHACKAARMLMAFSVDRGRAGRHSSADRTKARDGMIMQHIAKPGAMTRLRDLVRGQRTPAIQLPEWLDRLISIGIISSDERVIARQRCVNVAAF